MQATLFLEKRGKLFWGIVGIALVLSLGIVDYLTGYELSFSLFYLSPILLVTWFAGGRLGLVISAVGAITWFVADMASGHSYSHPMIYLWDALMRLGFFIVATSLLSALKRAIKTNQELARTDYITGAMSIRYFHDLAQMEISRSRRYNHPFAFAYIDLDYFKTINDRFGHTTGDKVLRAVANSVQRQLRNTDIFARLGGDEFALLLPETGEEEARETVSRIHLKIMDEMQKNGWPVTFSIGVVTCINAPKTVDDMIKMADGVMYSAKASGKARVSYSLYED